MKPKATNSTYVGENDEKVEEDDDEEESEEDLIQRCEELMKQDDVVLFMKGDRDTPRFVVAKLLIKKIGKYADSILLL